MIKIEIPDPVNYILKKLSQAGYEAYIVGGCVRDALIGRAPNDWDITTSALPMQVKEIFHRTIDTGLQHGTVTVVLREGTFEVTTYRIDGLYEDSRHPSSVTFTADINEDLRRRDFTINAMAYHPMRGIVDPFDGQGDLAGGVIRAVGCPGERFDEDALRIMRAVRFAAQLGFEIEEETLAGVSAFAPRLSLVSHERIRDELSKLLSSPHPEMFRLLYESGITKVILPVFDEMMATVQPSSSHMYNVGEHTLKVLENIQPPEGYQQAVLALRLAALLHDMGKPATAGDAFRSHHEIGARMAADWMRAFRFDNDIIRQVSLLILYHDFLMSKDEAGVRTMLNRIGAEMFPLLMALMRADNMAKSPEARERRLPMIDGLSHMYDEIIARGECYDMRHLAVKGSDLIAVGVKPGPALGQMLSRMLDDVIKTPSHNTKEFLMREYL